MTGPDGTVVPISTHRSTARYDVALASSAGQWRSSKPSTAGQYRVPAARATEPGTTLAVGDNFARDIAMTTLGAATLGQ